MTRTHSLAEAFSSLSGIGIQIRRADGSVQFRRFSPRLPAAVVERLASNLEFCDCSAAEVIEAVSHAHQKGVEGGRVHDFLHAIVANKAGASELWTLDRNDFAGLGEVKTRNPAEQPTSKVAE